MAVPKIPASSYFRINDIILEIPPESIQIIKQDFNAGVATLRSRTSTRVKSGRREVTFIVKTTFATGHNGPQISKVDMGSWINRQLAPIMLQIRKCPFISIENEKIRKEMLGIDDGSAKKNMAAVVKSVDVTGNIREAEVIHVVFTMQWFNFVPYSRNFEFKDNINGRIVSSDVPGLPFEEFYKSGALDGNGQLFNSINPAQDRSLNFYYKQYYKIETAKPDIEAVINATADRKELDRSDVKSFIETAGDAPTLTALHNVLEKLALLGWQVEDEAQIARRDSIITISRYKKFVIPESIQLQSGALIPESFSMRVETKTPSIPLLGHTMPTAQFLGVADSQISFTLFANAELEKYKSRGVNQSGELPVGTSNKLAELNKIFELVNRNVIKYKRYSRTDSIYVEYPYVKLLKYQQYTDNIGRKFLALNEETGDVDEFDPNTLIPCTLENTVSQTVQGHPYCSRLVVQMTENQRNADSSIRFKNKGGTNRVYESTKKMLNIMVTRYGIERADGGSGKFVSTDRPLAVTPTETQIAERLIASANATLDIKDIKSISEALEDPEIVEKRTSELQAIRSTQQFGELASRAKKNKNAVSLRQLGADSVALPAPKNLSVSPLSYEEVNSISSSLIKMAASSTTERFSDYNEPMDSFTNYNLVADDSAYPDMMLPESHDQPDFAWYNLSDELYTEEIQGRLMQKAWERRKQIGEFSSKHFNTSSPYVLKNKEGASEFRPAEWLPFPAANGSSVNNGVNRLESEMDKPFAQAPLDESQQKANIQRSVIATQDNTYAMRRAMPTFKVYFREDDVGSLADVKPGEISKTGGLWRNFTDVYDMNAIVDIRMVKDENNPVDLLVLRITNTREDIVNRTYEIRDKSVSQIRKEEQINESATSPSQRSKKLNELDPGRLDGVILKEGVRIELRLGYENDPNDLSVEFTGRVADVSGGDVIEIMCQSDGIELVQELKGVGVADDFDWKSNTQDIISHLLHNSPEVSNFGTTGSQSVLGEVSFLWDSVGGRSVIDNIFAPSLFGTWSQAKSKAASFAQWGGLIGSLVPIPGIGTLSGAAVGAAIGFAYGSYDSAFNGSPFYIYEQTLWEVLQELTMRHPGTICGVVPFDRRSTIFFGYPDQLYFYRGPNIREILGQGKVTNGFSIKRTQRDVLEDKLGATNTSSGGGTSSLNGLNSKQAVKEKLYEGSVKPGDLNLNSMKPYRNYHLITSEHDIIENSMMVSSDGVFNAIEIVYPSTTEASGINVDGSKGFSEYKNYDTIKADDDLARPYIKKQTLVYHNANTNVVKDMPERYAVTNLCKSLQGIYKGKITIIGRPNIKPHDVVFIEDEYTGINGPVKVSKVTQIFSYGTGWVTEIHPAMIVAPVGSTEIESLKAIQSTAKYYALRNKKIYDESFALDFLGQAEKREISKVNETAQILNSEAAGTAIDVGATGAAIATARRAYESGALSTAAARAGTFAKGIPKNVTSLSGVSSVFKGLKSGAGSVVKAGFKTFKWAGVGFALDYGTSFYISWSKQRQPIAFLPVFRNGKPWYTGLHGLKNNSEMDAISESFNETLEEGGYLIDSMKRGFRDLID